MIEECPNYKYRTIDPRNVWDVDKDTCSKWEEKKEDKKVFSLDRPEELFKEINRIYQVKVKECLAGAEEHVRSQHSSEAMFGINAAKEELKKTGLME